MHKVPVIKNGSTVAVLSPSWGGPAEYAWVYERGLNVLKDIFGFTIQEYPTTRASAQYLNEHPEERARDLLEAFNDERVDGIICSIGGNDAIRLLPHLDDHEISPKFFMGYSDSTVLLTYLNQRGIVAFHGPSVMAGIAGLEQEQVKYRHHIDEFLSGDWKEYSYAPYPCWSHSLFDWNQPSSAESPSKLVGNDGWRIHNAPEGEIVGQLWGGCIEALAPMQNGPYWPYSREFWGDKVIMFELSDENISDESYVDMLRTYGAQGVFTQAKALLMGRFAKNTQARQQEMEDITRKVVMEEFGSKMPIVFNMDFGHTYPQQIFPLGCTATLSYENQNLSLSVESPFKS